MLIVHDVQVKHGCIRRNSYIRDTNGFACIYRNLKHGSWGDQPHSSHLHALGAWQVHVLTLPLPHLATTDICMHLIASETSAQDHLIESHVNTSSKYVTTPNRGVSPSILINHAIITNTVLGTRLHQTKSPSLAKE